MNKLLRKSPTSYFSVRYALHQTNINKFEDQVVFVIDYVVDVLAHNREALKLIDKICRSGFLITK